MSLSLMLLAVAGFAVLQSVTSAVHQAACAVPHATRSIAMSLQSMPCFEPRGGSFAAYKRRVETKFKKSMEEMRPNFGWLPLSRVKATLRATTQHYRAHKWGQKMKRHFKTRYPGANVPHTNESVSAGYASMKIPGEADGLDISSVPIPRLVFLNVLRLSDVFNRLRMIHVLRSGSW